MRGSQYERITNDHTTVFKDAVDGLFGYYCRCLPAVCLFASFAFQWFAADCRRYSWYYGDYLDYRYFGNARPEFYSDSVFGGRPYCCGCSVSAGDTACAGPFGKCAVKALFRCMKSQDTVFTSRQCNSYFFTFFNQFIFIDQIIDSGEYFFIKLFFLYAHDIT